MDDLLPTVLETALEMPADAVLLDPTTSANANSGTRRGAGHRHDRNHNAVRVRAHPAARALERTRARVCR